MSFPKCLPTIAILALASLLSGCVPYPVYKTMQPDARATVLDENSQPLADARVVLISSTFPYGREQFRNETRSASDGSAAFEALKEWRAESMMIHGAQVYFWNWCVEKTGYETYMTLDRDAAYFNDKPQITLRPGESRSCNNWPDRQDPSASR
ncbi:MULTISPECIES: hypothetical protein [Achromobacter]|uniref:Carboxypeptidase regulatory-like domain-containing protein n=1 Tax=Alcaligenes xylosoxydans xylosoxydans TaxID=85698 RepID=A0A424W6S1_ALCXX|nr:MULTISPECIES: hypothetical protein [Achromobacter]MBC9908254.1 carboxypeptidase regulatory-like domain-containing protein [Achromobacter xylosoxidans]MBD0871942.1 carboxypeptidase regulatory-like domain-containing protein [Achromobacter xylosoxidans]QNP88652.1 carboxypeptidase regulatory-like domain-containing protein [Achromobacter xylosoxidans]RPJ88953.1 carboxypeptidase regulatory-like domain-containing protein [Achromobacter xylosoxidans]WLW64743.1 carboxypeptidase regulatory-like domai